MGYFYLVLFSPAKSFSLVLPIPYAWDLQSALTDSGEIAIVFPVALCQSKQLTSLGIARWQTVVLLLSMLSLIKAMANLSAWFPVFPF